MSISFDPTLYLKNQTKERTSKGDVLGKDDFLKILMTQLQNQDPLNPMQDKDFIAQMATFTSLEQMTNMNKMLENFINTQNADNILKYSEMIGKKVEWGYIEDGVTETGVSIVKSVIQANSQILLELEDGTKIPTSFITKVMNQENPQEGSDTAGGESDGSSDTSTTTPSTDSSN
ncbi:flagellar hook assembly protein FlgD [Bacillus salitolerans]|uniref:Flagellar hook assembly protein FlgD n=1 Tax=Bacillus salitolerans TaxID=1437434 RepID=A0ABW4LM49_9BACI